MLKKILTAATSDKEKHDHTPVLYKRNFDENISIVKEQEWLSDFN